MAPTTYVPSVEDTRRYQREQMELAAAFERTAQATKARELADLDRVVAFYRAQATTEYGEY